MIPWIQIYSNLVSHPKTDALAEKLNLSCAAVKRNVIAAGMLVGLWSWAAQNATDGDLSTCTYSVLADAAGWKKKPEVFINALVSAGWVDRNGASLAIHDWEDYASLLMEQMDNQKQKTNERVKRYRDKKKVACNGGCNVTETFSNGSTVPNHTIPYNTLPEERKETKESEPADLPDGDEVFYSLSNVPPQNQVVQDTEDSDEPNPNNPFGMSDKKLRAMAASYRANGWSLPPGLISWEARH